MSDAERPPTDPYLTEHLREALAREEGELGITVHVGPDVVTLRGVVQTSGRRERIERLCRALCGAREVSNAIEVCPPRSPGNAETLP